MQTNKWLSFEWQTMLSQSAYRWGVHVWHTPLFSLPILPNTVTVKNISFWYTLTHSTIFFRYMDAAFTHVGTASLLSDPLSVSWAFSLLVTYLYHLWGIAFTAKFGTFVNIVFSNVHQIHFCCSSMLLMMASGTWNTTESIPVFGSVKAALEISYSMKWPLAHCPFASATILVRLVVAFSLFARIFGMFSKYSYRDSNSLQPLDHKPHALPTSYPGSPG